MGTYRLLPLELKHLQVQQLLLLLLLHLSLDHVVVGAIEFLLTKPTDVPNCLSYIYVL